MTTMRQTLCRAFHEVTLKLLTLFETYGADPMLMERTANELEAIYNRNLGLPAPERRVRGKLAMARSWTNRWRARSTGPARAIQTAPARAARTAPRERNPAFGPCSTSICLPRRR